MLTGVGGDDGGVLDRLAAELRKHGFDVGVTGPGVLQVGPHERGPAAPRATVHLDGLLSEYLADLASGAGGRGTVSAAVAEGRLLTQLIESLDAIHDGRESNLTERVSLRRSASGHIVLDEQRVEPDGGHAPRSGGSYEWSADRP